MKKKKKTDAHVALLLFIIYFATVPSFADLLF